MPFLTVEELKTHMPEEIVEVISNGDVSIAEAAIDTAMEEASGYLSNYDFVTIFETEGTARNPVLLMYVKDIAIWHYIQLANPNVDMDLRERRYEFAIKWLEKVQKGMVTPYLPPIVPQDENVQVGKLRYGSNLKRITRY